MKIPLSTEGPLSSEESPRSDSRSLHSHVRSVAKLVREAIDGLNGDDPSKSGAPSLEKLKIHILD